jgi:hypothetical protein
MPRILVKCAGKAVWEESCTVMADDNQHSPRWNCSTSDRDVNVFVPPRRFWLRMTSLRLVLNSFSRLPVASLQRLLTECRSLLSTFTGLARDVALSASFRAVPAHEWLRPAAVTPHLKR